MDVVVNAAASLDGKLATRRRRQLAISGPEDFDRVDGIRSTVDAVMVGVGTVLADDPSLTVKDESRRSRRLERGLPSNPACVVADSTGRTPTDAACLGTEAGTYILASSAIPDARVDALERAGATVIVAGDDRVDLAAGIETLERRGVDRMLVEGGGELLYSCFEAAIVDEVTLYLGSMIVGGRDAPTLVDGDGFVETFPRLELTGVERLDDGVVLSYDVLEPDE